MRWRVRRGTREDRSSAFRPSHHHPRQVSLEPLPLINARRSEREVSVEPSPSSRGSASSPSRQATALSLNSLPFLTLLFFFHTATEATRRSSAPTARPAAVHAAADADADDAGGSIRRRLWYDGRNGYGYHGVLRRQPMDDGRRRVRRISADGLAVDGRFTDGHATRLIAAASAECDGRCRTELPRRRRRSCRLSSPSAPSRSRADLWLLFRRCNTSSR